MPVGSFPGHYQIHFGSSRLCWAPLVVYSPFHYKIRPFPYFLIEMGARPTIRLLWEWSPQNEDGSPGTEAVEKAGLPKGDVGFTSEGRQTSPAGGAATPFQLHRCPCWKEHGDRRDHLSLTGRGSLLPESLTKERGDGHLNTQSTNQGCVTHST